MAKVIGVKFKNSGKIYFFDSAGVDIHKDDHVIVETGMGIDYGLVVSGVREIDESKLFQPLKPILRRANERDEEQVKENAKKSKDAFDVCLEKVKSHGLDMKLTEVEYAFDNSKILFYFTSDGYVDFRELVKDLASTFRTRIELRQIGVRDEARAIGGLGACGRPMCCAAYLPDFVPVSIKMAKEQNLPLNPTKISGVCGRLMCCLKYEEETYEELNKTMPDVGDFVEGADGLQGDVFSTNVLRQTVKVLVENGDEKEMHDYSADEITVLRKRRGKKNNGAAKIEEVDEKQLEQLEDKPSKEEKRSKGDNGERRDQKDRSDKPEGGKQESQKNRGDRPEGQNKDQNRDNQNRSEGQKNQDGNRQDRQGKHGEGRKNRDKSSGDRPDQNQNYQNRPEGQKNQDNRQDNKPENKQDGKTENNQGNGQGKKFKHKKNRFRDKRKGSNDGNPGNQGNPSENG